jgi:D-glycero-alpha-D-manno-heptose-7-phosphate kinase
MIIRSKAPLRLGLAGGGTDVSPYCDEFGGCVLNATIDMHAYCNIEETRNNKVHFIALDCMEQFTDVSKEYYEIDEILQLHKGVYNRIVRDFHDNQPLSLKMTTYSDVPAGSGLGSSSTMVVAIIKAYTEWLNLPLGEYDIANLAYEVERKDIGLSGGQQDQYAATFGGFNFLEFHGDLGVIVNPLRIKNWIIDELQASMILFSTGASRSSADIIDEQKSNTRNKVKRSLEAMHALKASAYKMKEAVLKGDIELFADILAESWDEKKKMANSITNSDIESVYDAAIDAGAYAGKVSGAGGGGFMMFVVQPEEKLGIINVLKRFPGTHMNFNFSKGGCRGWKIY